jgi:hypothetical protein
MDRVSLPFFTAKATRPFVLRLLLPWAACILAAIPITAFAIRIPQLVGPMVLQYPALPLSPKLLSTSRKAHAGGTPTADLQKAGTPAR